MGGHTALFLLYPVTYAATRKGIHSVIDTENEFRSVIFYKFVILVRPESIPESESESESTPWIRVGVGVGVTQKPIDSAALLLIIFC